MSTISSPATSLAPLKPTRPPPSTHMCGPVRRASVSLADAQRTASMLPFVVPMQKPPIDSKVALFARVAHAQRAAAESTLPMHGVEAWRTPTTPELRRRRAGTRWF